MENLDELRWVEAPISIEFAIDSADSEAFFREFGEFAQSDDDPLSEWIKMSKARGEAKESDQVLLAVLIDLHRKIDALTEKIDGNIKKYTTLESKSEIEAINFTHFKLPDAGFEAGKKYYGRVTMPIFPARFVPLFFVACSENIAKIVLMHDHDQRSWDGYTTARERVMIRSMRGKNG